MAMWGRNPLLVAIPLWMSFGRADCTEVLFKIIHMIRSVPFPALSEPQICYVLDGVLFLYGIILTALYCRLKIINAKVEAENTKAKQNVEEGIYTGLTPHAQDTYETIGMRK